ncbi:MAG TPA: LacI family DNA-binding transcriptional regulator [Actinocrinis sp.]
MAAQDPPSSVEPAARPGSALTIYDVARHAGVSIASVSRVLNGHASPRPETRERVLRAVDELGFVPDGAARALSSRLKEVVSVVFRRAHEGSGPVFEDEAENLAFIDVINRGVEAAAQRRGFDLLLSSVAVDDATPWRRIANLAGKSDGVLLHDRVLIPDDIARLADRVPVVTLAGTPTPASVNICGDNGRGMRELAEHLLGGHGYPGLGYLAGHLDSPDSIDRAEAARQVAARHGAAFFEGPQWCGEYNAAGGAGVIHRLLDGGAPLPRAIACANDQSALGAIHALRERGLRVPQDVAVTGFDDVPVARHLTPSLTTVRQPIRQLGAEAFELLHAMIAGARPDGREVVLPVELALRASCGCPDSGGAPPPAPAAAAG